MLLNRKALKGLEIAALWWLMWKEDESVEATHNLFLT